MVAGATTIPRRRGRPARYLLSGIATCGVCDAPLRIGSQNGASPATGSTTKPLRYRVYECGGAPGRSGFHVSMRQNHLDALVRDAVLARVASTGFAVPKALRDDVDGREQQALRLEIKSHRVWLTAVRKEARRRGVLEEYVAQQRLVNPKIQKAQDRLDALAAEDAVVRELLAGDSVRLRWRDMTLEEQRHVVQALLVPRVNPVDSAERGQHGRNDRRVDLVWHGTTHPLHS